MFIGNIEYFLIVIDFQSTLTKNDRLDCDARLACHKLRLPSPSAMPNLLPCCEKRHRVTLANVPGGRGVQTTCWCPHSHIWTEPSWPPVKYNGINGCAHIRFILSTLCFNTFWREINGISAKVGAMSHESKTFDQNITKRKKK